MDLARKLARVPELRAKIEERIARDRVAAAASPRPAISSPSAPADVPDVVEEILPPDHCHGRVPIAGALHADLDAIAWLARDPVVSGADARRMLFLDTETTGLFGGTGTLAFLIGFGWFEDQSLVVRQLFLKRPGEERPILESLAERLEASSLLVTYNGKAFDLPLLMTRFVLHRVASPKLPPHLDLLHAARRVYKRRLGRVRLVHVEEQVLRMRRERDVEGHEIPAIYWSYVRGGPPGPMNCVIEHNQNDIIALAALLARMSGQIARVNAEDEPEDHLSIALAARAGGKVEVARAFAEAAEAGGGPPSVTAAALSLLAHFDARAGAWEVARARLEAAATLCPEDQVFAARVHLRLARLFEHKLKDQGRALLHAHRGAAAEPAEIHSRRIARIERKLYNAAQ